MINVNIECKKPIKHCACKEDDAWNPNTYAYKCDKDCEIKEYLKNYTFVKSIIDDLVITCDEILDTPDTMSIDLVTIRLLFLIIIANYYYTKYQLKQKILLQY